MTGGDLILILLINFIITIIIVIFIIRHVSERFNEQIEDNHDKIKNLEERCKFVENKIEKMDCNFSRVSDKTTNHQSSLSKDLEKVKFVIQGIDKKTEKIFKRTEKLYNKR